MRARNKEKIIGSWKIGKSALLTALVLFGLLWFINSIYAAQPSAPDSMVNISSSSPDPDVGAMINTTGGSITTINFNATTQNPRWKGFVGNISGTFALQDASGMSLYDWSLSSITGEIYATRKSSLVDWNIVVCANQANISSDQSELGFLTTDDDNVNKTFNGTTHPRFYAGDALIAANSCPSTNLYIGGAKQSDYYTEVLLYETKVIYVGLLENKRAGFNNQVYDYQIIVPDQTNTSLSNEPYYFYIELI